MKITSDFIGNAQIVLKPNTTEEVSQIMQHCHSRNLAVVPQGGNTGLNGGCIAIFDEVVISTSLMNQVINLDELTGMTYAIHQYYVWKNYVQAIIIIQASNFAQEF